MFAYTRRVLARTALLVASLGIASAAHAQECPEPPLRGPQLVTPVSGASGVTVDAPVVLTYSAGYFGPEGPGEDPSTLVVLEECGDCVSGCVVGSGVPVEGTVEVHGDRLYFLPASPLADATAYAGLANGAETSLTFGFCTGSRTDDAPPTLGGLSRPSSTRVGTQCGLPDGGYRLGLSFPPATDDGPPGSIEYLLYLSRAEGLEAPRIVSREYNYAASQITLGVLLTPAEVRSPICLTLAAVDGVGRVTVSPDPQCFDAITRTTFAGEACHASPGRRDAPMAIAFLLLALGIRRISRAR